MWIFSQDQSPAVTRQLCHFRDVVAAKVQNTQRLGQRELVNIKGFSERSNLWPKGPCEAAPCSFKRDQLSTASEGPQKVLRQAELWSLGHV